MTHTLANGIRICTVDCPEGATEIMNTSVTIEYRTTLMAKVISEIPLGNWTLLGRFEEITEETWKGVMPYYDDSDTEGEDQYAVTSHFKVPVSPDGTPFDSFTEAARSLIPGNPVVLIEKK